MQLEFTDKEFKIIEKRLASADMYRKCLPWMRWVATVLAALLGSAWVWGQHQYIEERDDLFTLIAESHAPAEGRCDGIAVQKRRMIAEYTVELRRESNMKLMVSFWFSVLCAVVMWRDSRVEPISVKIYRAVLKERQPK